MEIGCSKHVDADERITLAAIVRVCKDANWIEQAQEGSSSFYDDGY
jgi:hypothetical protein